MAERRSIGNAITMTPEKLAFIQGSTAREKPAETRPVPEEPKIDPPPAAIDAEELKTRSGRRQSRGRSGRVPDAGEVLNQMLVPITIRLQHRVAQALRRAHLEQRLNNLKPDTQQEIVDEALITLLTKWGYLESHLLTR